MLGSHVKEEKPKKLPWQTSHILKKKIHWLYLEDKELVQHFHLDNNDQQYTESL